MWNSPPRVWCLPLTCHSAHRPPVFSLHPAFPSADRSPAPDFLSPGFFLLRHSILLPAAHRPSNRRRCFPHSGKTPGAFAPGADGFVFAGITF